MKETIISIIVALVFTLSAIIVAAMRGEFSARAKKILIGLVAEAESFFGGGTGKIKFSSVFGRLYETMPDLFGLLFSEKTVADWIEEAVSSLEEDMPPADPARFPAADAADHTDSECGGAA